MCVESVRQVGRGFLLDWIFLVQFGRGHISHFSLSPLPTILRLSLI